VKENAESLDLRGVSSSLRRNDGGRVEDVDFDVSGVIDVDRDVGSDDDDFGVVVVHFESLIELRSSSAILVVFVMLDV